MFLCPNCQAQTALPTCNCCGYEFPLINEIWQLSDAPDLILSGEGDKYIGYEHIGQSYSGSRRLIIEERDRVFAKFIAEQTNDGIFLDLACGDGCFTVPAAACGVTTIAGDISNKMLLCLKEKAEANDISLENVTLCRMNALSIPLADATVTTAVANSVLHLISNPEKVITEIHRVLKQGGTFLCIDDAPGKDAVSSFDNTKYNEIVNTLYGEYWKRLIAKNIYPKRYRWSYDRDSICDLIFSQKQTVVIPRDTVYKTPLKEGFLPRFLARGFSDQVEVPDALHEEITKALLNEAEEKYGESFFDIPYQGVENDLLITVYIK